MIPQTASADPASGAFLASDAGAEAISNMYLTFDLGTEEYGVSIAGVTEIVGMQRIMPIPDMPVYLKGIINLRGKVIPLMDIRLRFSMPERAYDERTVIIVMEVEDAPVGLIVDGVREVREIPADHIDAHSRGRSGRSVISGIARVGEKVAVLLDPAALVSDDEVALAREKGAE